MSYEVPIFRQIKFDGDRTARELHVFWAAVELLDLVEERPMTLTALETVMARLQAPMRGEEQVRPSRSTISSALIQLEEAGYLYRRESDDGRMMWRVPLSRRSALPDALKTPRSNKGKARTIAGGVISEVF